MLKTYDTASDEEKEFFIAMINMPVSSKKALIKNIDTNYQNIALLKKEYLKLVPAGFTIYIEFKPADKVLDQPEEIDLFIYKGSQPGELSIQKWNLQYGDPVLDLLLKMAGWNYATLDKIKMLLHNANCVSIKNGEDVITIGYARSGMGMYFYDLFNKDLIPAQIKDYNDGCTYIYYKQNIVLEYGGGAIGSQCFPD